jgi:hypothetical protein
MIGAVASGGLVLALAAGDPTGTPGMQQLGGANRVLELRQYKIVPGKRDEFIALFEDRFIESQEALGMRLVGQFRDRDDPDRFTWIRSFTDMDSRRKELNAFYFGPVWKANRDRANPMLDDNDNVLLLRPASPELAFAPSAERPKRGAATVPAKSVVAAIEYLWKSPDQGFTSFFRDELVPALSDCGLTVVAAYVPEEAENNFPRLPVRSDRKILVWFATAPNGASLDRALHKLEQESETKSAIAKLRAFEERRPQILRLEPTHRSALR